MNINFYSEKEKSILLEIRSWSDKVLEKKNKNFNNLPACPFAKQTWNNKKVSFSFKHEKHYQSLYSLISKFTDDVDVVILVDTLYEKNPDVFHEYLDSLNQAISDGFFIQKDIWLMGFHPEEIGDNEALEEHSFDFEPIVSDKYAMIFVQRLTKLQEASESIEKLGYYETYFKSELFDKQAFNIRKKLYERVKNGNRITS